MLNLKSTISYFLAFLVSGLITTQAQEQTSETNSLKPGAWALQFGISNLLTLTSFQGATISVKYQTSATNAWRAGVSIYGNTSTSTNIQTPIQGDTVSNTSSLNNFTIYENVMVKVQYIWYANSEGIIHFYSGAGPIVGYGKSTSDYQTINFNGRLSTINSNNNITNNSSDTWSIGASGVIGVEYFPTRVFSLHAEYGNYLTYQSSKNKSTTREISNYGITNTEGTDGSGSSHGWSLSYGNVYFGLSVYF